MDQASGSSRVPTPAAPLVPAPVAPLVPQAVRQTSQMALQRNFPAAFGCGGKRKRKTPTSVKYMELQVCLLEGNKEHVPKDEIVLLQAGLGRRTVNISENADHEDISRALQEEYPKMRGLCGGWLLKKGCRWQWQEKNDIPTPGDTGVHGEDPKNIIQQRKHQGRSLGRGFRGGAPGIRGGPAAWAPPSPRRAPARPRPPDGCRAGSGVIAA
ncbi:unnamed protein product [Arctogadus glacialis]